MIRDKFCKNLHKVLSERGIKQVDLSNALNVPLTTVNGWMRGNHLPDLEMLYEICEFLDIAVGELIGDSRHPVKSDSIDHMRDIIEKQIKHIKNLENECKKLQDKNNEHLMIEDELMRQIKADEGMCEVARYEMGQDILKAIKDIGVSEITVKLKD